MSKDALDIDQIEEQIEAEIEEGRDPYETIDVTALPLYQSAPESIYICVSDEGILGHLESWNESINEHATWCEDAATSTTVEYVRLDKATMWRPCEIIEEPCAGEQLQRGKRDLLNEAIVVLIALTGIGVMGATFLAALALLIFVLKTMGGF